MIIENPGTVERAEAASSGDGRCVGCSRLAALGHVARGEKWGKRDTRNGKGRQHMDGG